MFRLCLAALAGAVVAAPAVLLLAPARVADTRDAAADTKDAVPDIGLDYRGLIREQMDLIGKGESGKAMEVLEKHALAPETFPEAKKDEFRKSFALQFATAGKYRGGELVGYKRLGSRYLKTYAVAHFEKGAITYVHLFTKNGEGAWKLAALIVLDGITELDAATPLVAFPPARD